VESGVCVVLWWEGGGRKGGRRKEGEADCAILVHVVDVNW